jgi:hypothetical protein
LFRLLHGTVPWNKEQSGNKENEVSWCSAGTFRKLISKIVTFLLTPSNPLLRKLV